MIGKKVGKKVRVLTTVVWITDLANMSSLRFWGRKANGHAYVCLHQVRLSAV